MTEYKHEIWEVIVSVLDGNPSPDDEIIFNEWIKVPENKNIYNYLSRLRYAGNTDHIESAKERVFRKVQEKIQNYRFKHNLRLWQYIAAASFLILISISSLWYYSNQSRLIANVETRTPFGVRSRITLSDGTTVYLNSGSSLSYPVRFTQGKRKVVLKGEAYFEVTKDPKHPFVVNADNLDIRVLGTHFDVKAYADDNKVVTTLLEGAVDITGIPGADQQKNYVLAPNQQAVYIKDTKSMNVHKVEDASLYAIWKDGQLYFDNERFADITKKLERAFNMKIRISSDKLKNELFSGQFDSNENIYKILYIMKRHRDFTYKIDQDTIDIFQN